MNFGSSLRPNPLGYLVSLFCRQIDSPSIKGTDCLIGLEFRVFLTCGARILLCADMRPASIPSRILVLKYIRFCTGYLISSNNWMVTSTIFMWLKRNLCEPGKTRMDLTSILV